MEKTLTIDLDLSNAAFEEDGAAEVARILRDVGERLMMGGLRTLPIRDVNGNRIGHAVLVDDEADYRRLYGDDR